MQGIHRALRLPAIGVHEGKLAGAWAARAATGFDPVCPHPWPPPLKPFLASTASRDSFSNRCIRVKSIASDSFSSSSSSGTALTEAAAMPQDCPSSSPQTTQGGTATQASMPHTSSSTPQQGSFETLCLAVDPASFPWQTPPTTSPGHHQGSPTANPDLSHIQHDSLPLEPGPGQPGSGTFPQDLQHLQHAASLIQQGHPVAVPTETVYGLAANALNADSVKAIYAAKQRPADNPLIVHISSLDMLLSLYPAGWTLPDVYTELVAKHWPGPLTILLPKSPKIPDEVVCGQPTMAVRMPSHAVARALIALSGVPLAAPSANSSGKPSPTTAQHVMQDLAGRVPLVLDGGPCGCGVESTVLDALRQPPVVLRPGGVTVEQLAQVTALQGLQVYQKHFVDAQLEAAPTTPGMKYRHYSPQAPITLLEVEGSSSSSSDLQALRSAAATKVVELVHQVVAAAAQRLGTCSEGGAHQGEVGEVLRVGVLRTSKGVGLATGLTGRDQVLGMYLPVGQQGAVDVVEYVLGDLAEPEVVARELFRALRCMDDLQVGVIVAEGVLEQAQGLAVMNRLRKAASCTVQL